MGFQRIVYFELLSDKTNINSEVYCEQLNKLSDVLKEKRPELVDRNGVVLQQYSSWPHTCLITHQKLLQLEWNMLPHPPYSPKSGTSDNFFACKIKIISCPKDGKNYCVKIEAIYNFING